MPRLDPWARSDASLPLQPTVYVKARSIWCFLQTLTALPNIMAFTEASLPSSLPSSLGWGWTVFSFSYPVLRETSLYSTLLSSKGPTTFLARVFFIHSLGIHEAFQARGKQEARERMVQVHAHISWKKTDWLYHVIKCDDKPGRPQAWEQCHPCWGRIPGEAF